MAINHFIYITNDENSGDPEGAGSEGSDWIFLVCEDFTDTFNNENTRTSTAGHTIFEIKLEKIDQSVTLQKCYLIYLGDDGTSNSTSEYYNRVKRFLGNSCKSGGDTLYLMVYKPITDTNATWVRWMDGDGDWQNYLKVRIGGFSFKFNAQKRCFVGSISLEEVTT